MITPYGYDNAFIMLGVAACLLILAFTVPITIVGILCGALGVILCTFTLWFFRDAERPLNPEALKPGVVIAPADGTVMEIIDVEYEPDIDGPGIQISIFLSPVNLHVNRYPATGTITQARYVPGKYLMAFDPKSSLENERSIFVLKTVKGLIRYTQITGFLARRIVYDTKQGDVVKAGDRFGMMKFGSRMDITLPKGTAINVKPGEKTVSSQTIIARL